MTVAPDSCLQYFEHGILQTTNFRAQIPSNATVTGTCSLNGTNNTQEITLNFFDGWTFTVVIGSMGNYGSNIAGPQASYSWEEIDVHYIIDDHFVNPKEEGTSTKMNSFPKKMITICRLHSDMYIVR